MIYRSLDQGSLKVLFQSLNEFLLFQENDNLNYFEITNEVSLDKVDTALQCALKLPESDPKKYNYVVDIIDDYLEAPLPGPFQEDDIRLRFTLLNKIINEYGGELKSRLIKYLDRHEGKLDSDDVRTEIVNQNVLTLDDRSYESEGETMSVHFKFSYDYETPEWVLSKISGGSSTDTAEVNAKLIGILFRYLNKKNLFRKVTKKELSITLKKLTGYAGSNFENNTLVDKPDETMYKKWLNDFKPLIEKKFPPLGADEVLGYNNLDSEDLKVLFEHLYNNGFFKKTLTLHNVVKILNDEVMNKDKPIGNKNKSPESSKTKLQKFFKLFLESELAPE